MENLTPIITLIVGIFGGGGAVLGIAALLKVRSDNAKTQAETVKTHAEVGKVDADTAEVIGKAWGEFARRLQDEQVRQAAEILELRADLSSRDQQRDVDRERIQELEDEVQELRALMEKSGLKPPPRRRRSG